MIDDENGFLQRGPSVEADGWLRLLLLDIQKVLNYDYGITARLRIFPRDCDKIVDVRI